MQFEPFETARLRLRPMEAKDAGFGFHLRENLLHCRRYRFLMIIDVVFLL